MSWLVISPIFAFSMNSVSSLVVASDSSPSSALVRTTNTASKETWHSKSKAITEKQQKHQILLKTACARTRARPAFPPPTWSQVYTAPLLMPHKPALESHHQGRAPVRVLSSNPTSPRTPTRRMVASPRHTAIILRRNRYLQLVMRRLRGETRYQKHNMPHDGRRRRTVRCHSI